MCIELLVHTIVWINLSIILIIVSTYSYLRFLVLNEYELQHILAQLEHLSAERSINLYCNNYIRLI